MDRRRAPLTAPLTVSKPLSAPVHHAVDVGANDPKVVEDRTVVSVWPKPPRPPAWRRHRQVHRPVPRSSSTTSACPFRRCGSSSRRLGHARGAGHDVVAAGNGRDAGGRGVAGVDTIGVGRRPTQVVGVEGRPVVIDAGVAVVDPLIAYDPSGWMATPVAWSEYGPPTTCDESGVPLESIRHDEHVALVDRAVREP